MSFTKKLQTGFQRHVSNLKSAHDKYIREAESRADAKLARAKSQIEREKIRAQLAREKLNAQRELYEAKTAAAKAKSALQKAKREAGDVGMVERFTASVTKGVKSLQKTSNKPVHKRRPTKHKTTKRKPRERSINDILWG